MNSAVPNGLIKDKDKITPPVACATGQEYTILTNVATAKVNASGQHGQMAAAYVGDTYGNLRRYTPTLSSGLHTDSGDVSLVLGAGCSHPLHFAPTTVQIDRDNPAHRAGEIYLAQVTNSAYDRVTRGFPASQMIIARDVIVNGVVSGDATFPPVVLSTANQAQSCGITDDTGTICNSALPAGARPASPPMAILKADGSGFQVYAIWYIPPANACGKGTSYLTVHEITAATAVVRQKIGIKLADEAVSGTVFVGGKLFYTAETAGAVDITAMVRQMFQKQTIPARPSPAGSRR